jgi:gliding motility-associated-like protein
LIVALCFANSLLWAQSATCDLPPDNDCGVQLNAVGGIDGPTEFCEGDTVHFRNTSEGTIDSTLYCWGDGKTTLVVGITAGVHIYAFNDTCLPPLRNGLQSFIIKMIVFKKCGTFYTSHFITTAIRVRVKPKVSFSAPDTACAETNITFTDMSCRNDSASRTTYLWTFGDGDTLRTAGTVIHQYRDTGRYTARLTITNRCGSRTVFKDIYIPTKPVIANLRLTEGSFSVLEPYVVCLKDSGIIQLDGSLSRYATKYRWTIVPNSGFQWLPAAPSVVDTNTRVRLRFTTAGTYTVSLTVDNICGQPATKTIQIKVVPNTILTLNPQKDTCNSFRYFPTPNLAGAVYTFDGTTFNANTGILVASGAHTVRATFDNECGHQDTTFSFRMDPFVPAAMVSPAGNPTICVGIDPIPLIVNQLGGLWTSSNVQARFLTRNDTVFFDPHLVGTFLLTFNKGTADCATQTALTINVVAAPTVDLNAVDTVCVNSNSNPRLITFSEGGNATTINWTFGTGNPATFSGQTPSTVTWNTAGTHQITVSATNLCGTRRDTTMMTVLPDVQTSVTPTTSGSCVPMMVDFNNATLNATTYNWRILKGGTNAVVGTDFRFENGTSDTSKQLKITFLRAGNYNAVLQAAGRCVSNSWSSQTFVVKDKPTIRLLNPNSICVSEAFLLGSLVQLYDNGNDNTTILTWTTAGASTTTSTGLNPPSLTWNTTGTQSIVVGASNSCGADAMTISVDILPRGVASATVTGIPADSCAPFNLTINNTSTNGSGYTWQVRKMPADVLAVQNVDYQYVSPDNATTRSPTIRFLKEGNYKIGLGVNNACQGSNWETTISVRTKPKFALDSITPFCEGGSIAPILNGLDTGNTAVTYHWTFEQGNPASSTNKITGIIQYNSSGLFPMTANVSNLCGDTTAQRWVRVNSISRAVVNMPTIPNNNCAPFSVTMNNNSTGGSGFQWQVVDENGLAVVSSAYNIQPNATAQNPTINFLQAGRFKIKLNVLNNNCTEANWTSSVIYVRVKPTLTIGVDTAFCVGNRYQPRLSSFYDGNDTTAIQWFFQGGNPATAVGNAPPTVQYDVAGVYPAIAVATNHCGTVLDTARQMITVRERGAALVTVTGVPTDSCGPFVVTMNNRSTGVAAQSWNVTNAIAGGGAITQGVDYQYVSGTNATAISPQIQFLKGGQYKIVLIINNTCAGDSWDTTIFVRTKAVFAIDSIVPICEGNSIAPLMSHFDNGYTPVSFNWTFNSGNPASATNQIPGAIQYNSAGVFAVTAAVTNVCGTTTVERWARVNPISRTVVTMDSFPECVPFTLNINNLSTGTDGFRWKILYENGDNAAALDYNFDLTADSTSRNPRITFKRGGKFKIALQLINNACAGAAWMSTILDIKAKPKWTIGQDTTFCVNNSYQPRIKTLDSGNDTTSIHWIFLGGTPAVYTGSNPPLIRYDVEGTYSVVCIAKNRCGSDTAKQVLTILPSARPQVVIRGIGADSCVDLPFSLTINNTSTNATAFRWFVLNENNTPADVTTYSWGGSSSTERNPNLTFLKNGRYRLRLEIDNNCVGASWDTVFQIYTKPAITVNPIVLTGVCRPQTFGFQGNILDAGGLPVRYRWQPTGDITLIVLPRRFDTTGNVQFVLTATNQCGMVSAATTVTIQPRPIVRIQRQTRDTICNSDPAVQLTASPLGGSWSGTGVGGTGIFDPSSLSNATYPIVYQYGTGDCIERDTYRLTVFGTPVNAGPPVALCDVASPVFTLLGATPLNGRWTGTGIVDPTLGRFSPTVAGAGIHSVTYTYIDSRTGCANRAVKQVTIFNRPKAVIDSIPPGCRDIEVQMTGINSLLSTSYDWKLGYGGNDTSTQVSPRCTYRSATTYTVRLIVTSRDGCKDTTTRTVRIAAPPTALPVPKDTIVCHQSTIPFRTTGIAENFLWTYPDGSATNFPVPAQTYRFNNTGLKDTLLRMRLAVTNTGCPTKTDTIKVTVQPQLKAIIIADKNEICNNDSIRFTNPSRGHVRNWYWDLDLGNNGLTSRDSIPLRNVGIRYQTVDTVRLARVRLIVEGDCGRDTAYYLIRVLPITTRAFFNMDKNTGCPPLTVRFENASSSFAGITYNFGDNTPNSSEPIVNHTFTKPGIYRVLLYAFNNCGGFDAISQVVTVKAAPPIDSIVYRLANDCHTTDVQFQSYTHGLEIIGHLWRFDNGDSSRSAQPSVSFQNGGIHKVYLTLFSGANNCPSTDSLQITLLQSVDLGVSSVLSDSCGTADGVIVLNPRGGTIPYRFSLDDTLRWNTSPIFPHLQGRQYHIGYVKDARGCTDTVAIYVPGAAPLSINAGGNVTVKLGDSTRVRATMNFNAVSVQWKSANQSWIRTPMNAATWIMPLRTQVFGVFGQATNGCVASDSMRINVIPIKFIDCPTAFSPNNDGGNDYLKPQCSKDVIKIRVFRIYNRWGMMVYERLNFDPQDTNGGWDGTYGGVEQPIDVYTWYCEADFLDETSTATPVKGSTSLIR